MGSCWGGIVSLAELLKTNCNLILGRSRAAGDFVESKGEAPEFGL